MFGIQSDVQLVRKTLKGGERAWDKLVDRYKKKIYNFALRMTGNREDALDLTQEVFLAAWRNLNGFSQTSPFRAWLFTIASRRATDFFRRRKPVEALDDEHLLPASEGVGAHDALRGRETNRAIRQLLAQLNPEQRLVVEMKFFQDLTFEEISQKLDVSSNTIKSRLYGALKKMKDLTEVIHAL